MTSPLYALAREAALRRHCDATDAHLEGYVDALDGHVDGDDVRGFSTCPHPDCVRVREPEPTITLGEHFGMVKKSDDATPIPILEEMVVALKASVALYTSPPRKFDEAVTWRDNDDKVRTLVTAAIARGSAALDARVGKEPEKEP